MESLLEVDTAKALMTEAMNWSVMKWLREKKTVRKTADLANAALDRWSQSVRECWPEPLRSAYEALAMQSAGTAAARRQRILATVDMDAVRIARDSKEMDEEAFRARMDAEKCFDDAERQLSTVLAREGCRKAIHSWDLHLKAIQKAEAVIHKQ